MFLAILRPSEIWTQVLWALDARLFLRPWKVWRQLCLLISKVRVRLEKPTLLTQEIITNASKFCLQCWTYEFTQCPWFASAHAVGVQFNQLSVLRTGNFRLFVWYLHTQKSGHKKKVSLMMAMAKVCAVFFHLLPKLYVCLIDGAARFFPNSYVATGIWTHVSSVAPLLRDFHPGLVTNWAIEAAATMLWIKKKLFFFSGCFVILPF